MANIWDEVEEVQEVKNTPQQQPTNDIWGEVEEVSTQPVEQATPVLTGRIEQKVIPNWDKKGRIYYTDEQGNRIKSNVPLSRKIGNQLRATGYNIKDWLTTDVGEKAKERRKAAAMLVSAPLGIGRGIAGMALSGGLGSGVYSGAEQAIEGEFKPKQLLADIGIGAALGGALGLGGKYAIQPIVKNIARRTNIAKRRATPLADRMTEEQLNRLTDPKVEQNKNAILDYETMPDSELDYRTLTDDELELLTRPNEPIQSGIVQPEKSEINQQLADNINNKINNTLEKIKNHENTVLEINNKYGGIDNLRKELAMQMDEYGRVSDVNMQQTFDRYLAEQSELANDPYFDFASNIDRKTKKMSATWEKPRQKYTQQGQEQIEEVLPTTQEKNVVPTRSVQQFNEVIESVPQQFDDVIEETVPIQEVDEVIESVPQQTEQPKTNLNTLKSNIRANKFERGNLKDYMVVNKGKKGYKSTIADPISYDIEKSQRDFNKIITEISKNPEKLNDEAYLNDLQNRVQQIVDRTPYGETEEVAMPYWEKLWKAVDDGYNYNEFKLNRGNKPQQLADIIPEQVVKDTAKTKERSFVDTIRQNYGDDVAKQIGDREYDVYSHEMQKANWENRTPEQKIQALNEVDNINPDVLYGKAQALNQAIQNGEPLNVAMLDGIAKNLTKAGQEIEATKHFIPTSPEGIVLETIKQTRKNTPKQVLKLKDETS